MSYKLEEGFRTAIENVVSGIVIGALISAFLPILKTFSFVPSYYISLFQLIEVANLVGSILIVFAMEKWGFFYLLGWLLGMWIMSYSGLIEMWLLVLYGIVGSVVLVIKILKWLGL
jgi:hypothetical protein